MKTLPFWGDAICFEQNLNSGIALIVSPITKELLTLTGIIHSFVGTKTTHWEE